ncbi:hypothetical protein ES708_32835 [subsurface metagenome]
MCRFIMRRWKRARLFLVLIVVLISITAAVGHYSPVHATGSGTANYEFYLFDSSFGWPGVWVISCNAGSTSYTQGQWTVTNHSANFNVPNGRAYPFQLNASSTASMYYTYPYSQSTITLPTTSSMGPPQDYGHAYWSYTDLVLQSWQYPILAYSTCYLSVGYPWYFTPGFSPSRQVRVPAAGTYQVAP